MPCSFHQSAPRSRMIGTSANVSTEFISVGLPQRPKRPGERRLVARLAAVALHALQQRRLLAEDVAAGRGEDLDLQAPPGAADVVAEQALPAQRARSRPRSTCSSGPYSWRMKTQPSSEPVTSIPSIMPSSTRCGCSARIWRSLKVPGLGLVGVADRVLAAAAPGRRRSPTSGRSGSRRRPCRAARSPSASRRSPPGAGRRRARGGSTR